MKMQSSYRIVCVLHHLRRPPSSPTIVAHHRLFHSVPISVTIAQNVLGDDDGPRLHPTMWINMPAHLRLNSDHLLQLLTVPAFVAMTSDSPLLIRRIFFNHHLY
jgi:hypothetical protein